MLRYQSAAPWRGGVDVRIVTLGSLDTPLHDGSQFVAPGADGLPPPRRE